MALGKQALGLSCLGNVIIFATVIGLLVLSEDDGSGFGQV
jgi:hypothetical protein